MRLFAYKNAQWPSGQLVQCSSAAQTPKEIIPTNHLPRSWSSDPTSDRASSAMGHESRAHAAVCRAVGTLVACKYAVYKRVEMQFVLNVQTQRVFSKRMDLMEEEGGSSVQNFRHTYLLLPAKHRRHCMARWHLAAVRGTATGNCGKRMVPSYLVRIPV